MRTHLRRSLACGLLLSALGLAGCGDDGEPAGSDCPELSGIWSVGGNCEPASCTVTQSACSLTLMCDDGERYTGTVTRTSATFSSDAVSCSATLAGDGENEDLALESGECTARDEGSASSCDFEASCTSGACTHDRGGDGDGDVDDGGVTEPIDGELCAQCLSAMCEEQMTTCAAIAACDGVIDCVLDSGCWLDDGACVNATCTTALSEATVESANATLHVQSCSLSSCADVCARSGGGAIGAMPGCSDACGYANDGECDDRGEGSMFDACLFGTDCSDCGSRDGETAPSCTEDCRFTNDGECDDGGPGAVTAECRFASDCLDCGPR